MIRHQVLLVALLAASSGSQAFVVSRARPSRHATRTFALSDHGPNKPGKLPVHNLDPHPTSSSVEHGVVAAPAPTGTQDPYGVVEHGVVGVDHPMLGISQDPHGPVEHGLMVEKGSGKPNLDAHPTSASVEHTLLRP